MSSAKKQLKEILLEEHLITEERLTEAMEIRKERSARLEDVLLDLHYVSEEDLLCCLSKSLGVPPVNLSRYQAESEVVAMIPKGIAVQYELVPLSKMGKRLYVAMSDPSNVFAIDDLSTLTHLQIKPVLASRGDIVAATQRFYEVTGDMHDVLKNFDEDSVEVEEEESQEQEISMDELFSSSEESPVIKVVNFILVEAIKQRASDIHIEPEEKRIRVRYRIDGVLYEDSCPPKQMQSAISSRLKIMANLNIAEKRLPQDGRIRIRLDGREIDYRLSTLPTYFGEKIVLRILDKSNLSISLDDLNFHPENLKRVRESVAHPHGMVLITGPTGSGKTTTLYSCLNEVNNPDVNIITTEDPVEYQLPGINQVPVNAEIGLTFAASLRSILRQDPDVVMIGEVRDGETADIAVKAALTGHLVFSTLHTNDAAGAVSRLDDMGIEPFLISSSLVMVAAQRLVRRICSSCIQKYAVTREAMERVGLEPDKGMNKGYFYKGKGCNECKGIGYKGRAALLEVLVIDDQIRELIINRANAAEIKKMALKNGMISLHMDGLDKVQKGITTIEEVYRVATED